jgi:hypothetical protein
MFLKKWVFVMEKNARLCKRCGLLKDRIESGKYPDGKNKRYTDESGKLWNGSVCAECNTKRSHENMKKLRAKRKELRYS